MTPAERWFGVAHEARAQLGLRPLARIVATGLSALSPEIMGLGPVDACRQAVQRAGMSIDDTELVELNEAFAAQVIRSITDLGADLPVAERFGGTVTALPALEYIPYAAWAQAEAVRVSAPSASPRSTSM